MVNNALLSIFGKTTSPGTSDDILLQTAPTAAAQESYSPLPFASAAINSNDYETENETYTISRQQAAAHRKSKASARPPDLHGSNLEATCSSFRTYTGKNNNNLVPAEALLSIAENASVYPPIHPHAPYAVQQRTNWALDALYQADHIAVEPSTTVSADEQNRSDDDAHEGTKTNAAGWRKTRLRKYKNPIASKHCHICSRTATHTEPHVVCSNIEQATCQKVTCRKCFKHYNWKVPVSPASFRNWKCTHCTGNCPECAQCVTYNKTTKRRRLNLMKPRKRRNWAVGDAMLETGSWSNKRPALDTSGESQCAAGGLDAMLERNEGLCSSMQSENVEKTASHEWDDALTMGRGDSQDGMGKAVSKDALDDVEAGRYDVFPCGLFVPDLTIEDGEAQHELGLLDRVPSHEAGVGVDECWWAINENKTHGIDDIANALG